MIPAKRINPAELELRPYLDRIETALIAPAYDGDYNDRLQDALDPTTKLRTPTRSSRPRLRHSNSCGTSSTGSHGKPNADAKRPCGSRGA
jgi:hypothetical protein